MDGGRKNINISDAMAHNRFVEQAREAEHLRRCAESPAYKRVYERWKQTMEYINSQQLQVAKAMREAMRAQATTETTDGTNSKHVCHGICPESLPTPTEWEQAAVMSTPFSAFIYASMFMTKEKWEQIPENVRAMDEMRQVDEEYDSHIIRMSGFEW